VASGDTENVHSRPRVSSEDQMDDFEQFLISLQRDLRTAFSQLSSSSTTDSQDAPNQLPATNTSTTNSVAGSLRETTADALETLTIPPGNQEEPGGATTETASSSQHAPAENAHVRNDSLHHPDNELARNASSNPQNSSVLPQNLSSATPSTSRPSNSQVPISWWRVHRFAPMRARAERPRTQESGTNEEASRGNETSGESCGGRASISIDDMSQLTVSYFSRSVKQHDDKRALSSWHGRRDYDPGYSCRSPLEGLD
jgi:hypothetical protein